MLLVANIIPSCLDYTFKGLIEQTRSKSEFRHFLYYIPGVCFFLVLAVRKAFFLFLGSRIGIMLGGWMIAGGCYFFWPIFVKDYHISELS